MRVVLSPEVRDLFVDGDGTAAVLVGSRVLALPALSAAVLAAVADRGTDGAEPVQLWAEVRSAVVGPPDEVTGQRVIADLIDRFVAEGLVSWMATE